MKVIVGVVVKNGDSILMIKEAKKKAYGKWNFPGGNLEEKENLFDAAIREFKEETGYDIKLKNILAIYNKTSNDKTVITIRFYGEIIGGNININEEILDIKWIPIEKIMTMKEELRYYNTTIDTINNLKQNMFYPLDIIKHE